MIISDEPVVSPSPAIEQAETKSIISNVSVDVSTVLEKNCFRFRDLLLHGRKKVCTVPNKFFYIHFDSPKDIMFVYTVVI